MSKTCFSHLLQPISHMGLDMSSNLYKYKVPCVCMYVRMLAYNSGMGRAIASKFPG